MIDSSMDNDVDSFSIDIGDPKNEYGFLLDRDCEVRTSVFLSDKKGKFQQVFTGIGDTLVKSTDDHTLSITGRDLSSLALSDAPPGKWRHVKPKPFITQRAMGLGFSQVHCHAMNEISPLYTDGSETEWAFWYRMARKRGMWVWTGPNGALWIDKLGYSLVPSYAFGRPSHGSAAGWVMPKRVSITKDTSGRLGEVWVYWQDTKANLGNVSRGIDTTIRAWKRLPKRIISSSTAKSQKDAKKEADVEVFESIVGAFEIELIIHDDGTVIEQNRMCKINIPELDLVGTYFVVGAQRRGGVDGMEQVVRVRQKSFALSKRVPDDPKLADPDAAQRAIPASMAAQLESAGSSMGIKWADSFVRATNEFGVAAGWDFSVFLGVLLAMCEKESTFHNIRQKIGDPKTDGIEWLSYSQYLNVHQTDKNLAAVRSAYEDIFRNDHNDSMGVGPMQLSSQSFKDKADGFGWSGAAKRDQFEGGRWNPDSNIRTAAWVLVQKLQVPPSADPSQADNIWIGVKRYNGAGAAADAYMKDVKRRYDATFGSMAQGVVAASEKKAIGTDTTASIPGHGAIAAPPSAPDIVKKAVNWAERRLGDPYKWGGRGPYYDCAGFVTEALYQGGLRSIIRPTASGQETTYTLFRKGRFQSINRDALLAGDLVFFSHGGSTPEHVGMYVNDGMFIHDPHTGDVVKWASLSEAYYQERYLGARRLVQWYSPSPGEG